MADGTLRRPNAERRFSWSKRMVGFGVSYSLFRRALTRRVHARTQTFAADTPRSEIARTLKRMRRELLAEVDAIDLRYLGVTEEAA